MSKCICICAALLAVTFTIDLLAEPKSSAPDAAPISLGELDSRGVAGALGVRLGTIVEVSGVVVENRSKLKANVSEPYFVRIETVDGRRLESPIEFPARAVLSFIEADRLDRKVGDRYHCFGYETGGFEGAPDRTFDFVQAFATTDYCFTTEFVEVKQIK
jgi:hypothetical protein